MKVLIVDDEPLARRELTRLLAAHPWVEICGEAAHAEEAQAQIGRLQPDLLLLDVQMPGASGFDLLERLELAPRVIFTTAFDQHAVRAFEVNALDYLLKPIEPARLATALERARAERAEQVAAGPALQRLFVRDGARCWFVPLDEVSLMSAQGNYVRLHWGEHQPWLARPLVALEQRLDPARFFRANRSQIVNLEHVVEIEAGVNGRLHLILRDGVEVEISRRQARLFRRLTEV